MERGTRVGQAYIAIAADGSGMNQEIVDSVDEAGDGIDKKGDEQGESYGDHFSDGFFSRIREKIASSLNKNLDTAGADAGNAGGDSAGRSFVSRMSDRVRSLGGVIGKDVGDDVGDSLSSRISASLNESLGNIDEVVDRVSRNSHANDALADWLGQAGKVAGERAADDASQSLADRLVTGHNQSIVGDGLDKLFNGSQSNSIADDFAKSFVNRLESRLAGGGANSPLGALFDRLTRDIPVPASPVPPVPRRPTPTRSLGSRVGSLLGAGSRSNILNTLGKTTGALIDSLTKLQSVASSVFDVMKNGFEQTEEGAAGAGGGISKILTGLLADGPAAAAVIVVIGLAMIVLVSIVNGLLAALTAMLSTITSGLVGALAVGAAGFIALGAAAGLAALAFMSMTNTQKDALTSAFKPLHEEAIGLGQVMITQMVPAFAEWSRNLQIALAYAQPLAAVMGGTFARAGDILTKSLSGPGIQLLIQSLSVYLPSIVTNLSRALGQFLNGLGGLFAAIMPFVQQFAVYLDRVATTFANWATSATGQNSIVDFISRALISLHSLWDLLGAVGGLLAAVLFSSQGQSAGNSIFDSLTNSVKKFTNYLQQDNHLDKWFAEGVTFAKSLGDAIVDVVTIIQSLNNSHVLDGISKVVDIGTGAVNEWSRLPGVLQDIIFPLKGVSDLISGIAKVAGFLGIGGGGSSTPTPDPNAASTGGLSDLLGAPLGLTGDQLDKKAAKNNLAIQSKTPSSLQKILDSLQKILDSLQGKGSAAMQDTSPAKGQLTPAQLAAYQAYANSIIKNGVTGAATIRNALNTSNKTITNALNSAQKSFGNALRSAANSTDSATLGTTLNNLVATQNATIKNTITTLKTNSANLVSTAQQNVNTAAESLANLTTGATQKQADAALAALAKAQSQLTQAKKAQGTINSQAKSMQAGIKAANALVKAQSVLDPTVAAALANGLKIQNATLADYANARSQIATRLTAATAQLKTAQDTLTQYMTSVVASIKTYGAITSAQAQVVNGVTQALTASDVTANLQTKLTQIQKFQSDLSVLLSEGLSNDAYKQLVDAGVDGGSATAAALVAGGSGAVQQVNSLTSQIGAAANQLGTQSSDRLYQAGVTAAQALVNGLKSTDATLAAQAKKLTDDMADGITAGLQDQKNLNKISKAARKMAKVIEDAMNAQLDSHSPSRVMIRNMENVGDGVVAGLGNQHGKVSNAASALSSKISVSPEVAAYASHRGTPATTPVNTGHDIDVVVNTTSDPEAVAHEVLNEIIGRL